MWVMCWPCVCFNTCLEHNMPCFLCWCILFCAFSSLLSFRKVANKYVVFWFVCFFIERLFLHLLCVDASHYFLSCEESFHNQLQNDRTIDWFSHRMGTTGYTSKRPVYSQLGMECAPIQINSIILIITTISKFSNLIGPQQPWFQL